MRTLTIKEQPENNSLKGLHNLAQGKSAVGGRRPGFTMLPHVLALKVLHKVKGKSSGFVTPLQGAYWGDGLEPRAALRLPWARLLRAFSAEYIRPP